MLHSAVKKNLKKKKKKGLRASGPWEKEVTLTSDGIFDLLLLQFLPKLKL